MLWLAVTLGIAVVIVLAVAFYGSFLMTRIPFLPVPYTPKDFGWAYESISFFSEDGVRLRGWFIPARTPSPATLIIQHGLGSNSGDMLPSTACLRAGPWNLLYYNFRGHGDSEGRFTSLGPLELLDMEAALRYLREQKAEASRRLGVYGHSLGAAVALVGAARWPRIEAVVAESSFASLFKTVARFSRMYHGIPCFPFVPLALWFASWRAGVRIGRFEPVEAVGKIAPRPVFLIQAECDARMPMTDFQALWKAAQDPKDHWVVPKADHGEAWKMAPEEYEKRLTAFFRKALA